MTDMKIGILIVLLLSGFGCLGIGGGGEPPVLTEEEARGIADASEQAAYFLEEFPDATVHVDTSGELAVDYRSSNSTASFVRLRVFVDAASGSAREGFVECKTSSDSSGRMQAGNSLEILQNEECVQQVKEALAAPPAGEPPPLPSPPPTVQPTPPPPTVAPSPQRPYTGPRNPQEAFFMVSVNHEMSTFALQYGPEYTAYLPEIPIESMGLEVVVNGQPAEIVYFSKTYGVPEEEWPSLVWMPGEINLIEINAPLHEVDKLDVRITDNGEEVFNARFTIPYENPDRREYAVLVIPVAPSDVSPPDYAPAYWIERLVFEEDLSHTSLAESTSLANWFKQNTHETVTLKGQVLEWVTLPRPLSYYLSMGSDAPSVFVTDALTTSLDGVDLAALDYDENGVADFVLLLTPPEVTAGLNNPDSRLANPEPFYGDRGTPIFQQDNLAVSNFLMIDLPETRNGDADRFGVLMREMLRYFPLREYGIPPKTSYWKSYLTDQRTILCYNIGPYDSMAYGDALQRTAENGEKVSVAGSLSGYSKYFLGYTEPEIVGWGTAPTTIRLYRSDSMDNPRLVQIQREEGDESKFYLIEWRQEPELQESNYAGLVIYHTTYRNSFLGIQPELCNTRELAENENNVYVVHPNKQREEHIIPATENHAIGVAPFIARNQVFLSPEGIRIEVGEIADDNSYVDVEIQYPE